MPFSLNRRSAVRSIIGGVAGLSFSTSSWAETGSEDLQQIPRRIDATNGAGFAAATVHPLATRAAQHAFKSGGNAFDAAIAATLMLGVVDGHNSGLGGGCFVLARSADGEIIALDGRETAPALAHRDMYLRDGVLDTLSSQIGPLASGVPGQVHALARLSKSHGRIGWEGGLREAARVARHGYRVGIATHSAIACVADQLRPYPASRKQYLTPSGGIPAIGDLLQQPDLAATLESLAANGPDWFYQGPFAAACADWMKANDGILRREDFANYESIIRSPLRTKYRDWQIIGFPPPSSGGIHVAQMLMMLENFDVKKIFSDSPVKGLHLLVEVMKRAFADRAHWLGDTDHVDVPRGLLDREYCNHLAASIRLDQVSTIASHGTPPNAQDDVFTRQHTTHLTTADQDGNWVSITNTINTAFGSGVVVPGTGVVLNNEMDDFSTSPGNPNFFGLIGGEANAIAPGKRPLSSMSPTLVLDASGNPRLACGAAGGPRIISAVLQCVVRVLDLGKTVEQALTELRVHHQWSPDQLMLEPQWSVGVVAELQSMGYQLSERLPVGVGQAIEMSESGKLLAATDPRAEGISAWAVCH